MAEYSGSVTLISGIKQKNNQDFPLVDASAVNVNLPQDFENDRLDDVLKELKSAQPGQVQADWEQSDSTQPDYIKNKPGSLSGETDPVFLENRNILTVADAGAAQSIQLNQEKSAYAANAYSDAGADGPYIAPWLFPFQYWYPGSGGSPSSKVIHSNDELEFGEPMNDPEFGWTMEVDDKENHELVLLVKMTTRSPHLFFDSQYVDGEHHITFAYGTEDEHQAVEDEPCVLVTGRPYVPRSLFPIRMYYGSTTSSSYIEITSRDKYTIEDGDQHDTPGVWGVVGWANGTDEAVALADKNTLKFVPDEYLVVLSRGTSSEKNATTSDTILVSDSAGAYILPLFDATGVTATTGVYRFDVHVSIPSNARTVTAPASWDWIQGRGLPANTAELAGKNIRLGVWYDCEAHLFTVGIMDRDLKSAVVKNGGTQALFEAANAGTASLSDLTTLLVAVYRTLGFTPA